MINELIQLEKNILNIFINQDMTLENYLSIKC